MQESEYWGQMPVIDVQWTRLVQIPALGLLVVLQVWVSVSSLRTPVTVYSLFLQGLSPPGCEFLEGRAVCLIYCFLLTR